MGDAARHVGAFRRMLALSRKNLDGTGHLMILGMPGQYSEGQVVAAPSAAETDYGNESFLIDRRID